MTRMISTVLAALVVAAAAPPIAAAQTADADLARMAAADLLEEIALLEEVGAFADHPVATAIHAWVDDRFVDRREALDVLVEVDTDNARNLRADIADGWDPGPVARSVLGALPQTDLARIRNGERGFLAPGRWLDGATDLLVRAGAPAPLPRGDNRHRVVLQTLEALPVGGLEGLDVLADDGLPDLGISRPVPARDAGAGAPKPANRSGAADAADARQVAMPASTADGPPVAALILVVGLVGLAAIALGVRRRRDANPGRRRARRPTARATRTSDTRDIATQVLEASRRMTAALDAAVICGIAVRDAVRMLGADAGAFLTGRGQNMQWTAGTDPDAFADKPDADGPLARIIETGQAHSGVLGVVTGAACSAAAAPVLVDGSVVGALVVVRDAAAPFTDDELATLELLTPVTGSALAAARTHHGAVTASEVDGLTKLKNRRRLDADLAALAATPSIGFAMLDIDHFKTFNDTNGHAAGDLALQLVADAIAGAVRKDDVVYRYGGEEFSVLLYGCDRSEVGAVMERVREAVEAVHVPGGEHQPLGRVTISAGVAVTGTGDTADLKARADEALYAAKAAGRNRVVWA